MSTQRRNITSLNASKFALTIVLGGWVSLSSAELVDATTAHNTLNEGIRKSLLQEIGAGTGDPLTVDSSRFIIARDPFRSVRRGRQLFQRKFTRAQGQGPATGDGAGDINTKLEIGAGLSDSCAGCHGRPRGSAGFGGDVVTRPDSRDAPHLFGLGLKEMLGDEITNDLRAIRATVVAEAGASGHPVTRPLVSKGIAYGAIIANPDGSVNTSNVVGVDPDLRVRPFFAHGETISIREFVVGALNNEMGLQAVDPELLAAANGGRFVTPGGMVLDGATDKLEKPRVASATEDGDHDGVVNEIPASIIDHFEFYLLNYFKPGLYRQTRASAEGRHTMLEIGCGACHIPNLTIQHDRRVADLETVYDPVRGQFNNLFATAAALITPVNDNSPYPPLKAPLGARFVVKNIFTDFKRHDLGANFHERNYDGSVRTIFLTTPLWGVGSTAPYGHDGRSINLTEVILRHGGEAQAARDAFARLSREDRAEMLEFLNTLVLFPPDDTASTLNPGNPATPGFPQFGHGSIRLPTLFNDPTNPE